MKRLLLFITAAFLISSCSEFDDSGLLDRVEEMEGQVTELESLCRRMNSDISAVGSLVEAIQDRDYITDVIPVSEGGTEIGYRIRFVKNPSVFIYHGWKGEDGADAMAPAIGVRQDGHDLRYYWTIDGEWVIDASGNRMPAVGVDGKLPVMKIENREWLVSYDKGKTWHNLGPAYEYRFFREINDSDHEVEFVFSDGNSITVPRVKPLDISFAESDLQIMEPNTSRDIRYSVSGHVGDVTVELMCSGNIRAAISSNEGASGSIHVETSGKVDEYCKVIVWVSDDFRTVIRTILFEAPTLKVVDSTEKVIGTNGGELLIEYIANHECEVIMPEDAPWITLVSTKAIEKHAAVLNVEPGGGVPRFTEIKVVMDEKRYLTYTVEQHSLECKVPDNEIWYVTSSGAERGVGFSPDDFDARVVEHVYEDGMWKIRFAGSVSRIDGLGRIYENPEIIELLLPDTIEYAYLNCCNLNLSELYIPRDLTDIRIDCGGGISRFLGYHVSADDRAVILNGDLLAFASAGIEEYTVPLGVSGIKSYSFEKCLLKKVIIQEGVRKIADHAFLNSTSLEEVTLPSTVSMSGSERLTSAVFAGCSSLAALYGPNTTEDHRCLVRNGNLDICLCTGLKEYVYPNEVKRLQKDSFLNSENIEILAMTDNVERSDSHFYEACPNLKELTISARMEFLENDPFTLCRELERIYCLASDPPHIGISSPETLDFENLTIYVPQESLKLYESKWKHLRRYLAGSDFSDRPNYNLYTSFDYSRDGAVTELQKASVGNGIDLILMGDAYSDRLIADGTYSRTVSQVCEAFFSAEPFKSFRGYFNVYQVDVVSANEVYRNGSRTSLGTWFRGASEVGGDDETVFSYALKAIPEERMDDALIVVMMNRNDYAGTCYMYNSRKGDYGSGTAVAYFPASKDDETFSGLVLHEAGGHGFAKLADEYAYEKMGGVDAETVEKTKASAVYGWYKNIDFTSDPSKIKWGGFIEDKRYGSEKIGAYEGGLTYWRGVWRPTENSIMKDNKGGFNAPSREAIYYRINKLAFGEGWKYDYDEFVDYDAVNRVPASRSQLYEGADGMMPGAPPVIYDHAWNE